MKFNEKCRNGILKVKVRAGYYEHIDEQELEIFSNNLPRGFLNPKEICNNIVEYEGPAGISLCEYLKTPIRKRTFFIIAAKAVAAMEIAQQRHFKLSNICISPEHVYINVSTREINFIYLPLENTVREGGFKSFFRNFVSSVIPYENEDGEFGPRFFNYLISREKITFRDVNDYISREDFQAVRAVRSYSRAGSEMKTDRGETSVLSEFHMTEIAGVMFSEDEQDYISEFPVLRSTSSSLKAEINKPVFRIGKDKPYADFFIGQNPAVSRNHADIISREEHFYIKDLNSTNGTFVNNERVTGKNEREIHEGDIIRFANEEFIFGK